MRTEPTTTLIKNHTPVQTSVLYKTMDNLLKDTYSLFRKANFFKHSKSYDPFLLNLKLLISTHLKPLVQIRSGLTLKENNDLDTLQRFSDSLDQWKLKEPITYNELPKNDSLAFDTAKTADYQKSSEVKTLFIKIGLSKLGPAARKLLKNHYSCTSNFPEEITGNIQVRWDHRFKHLGALRRIYEELEIDLVLPLLEASSCDLPVLFTCIELGELLLRKEYYPDTNWVLQDPEVSHFLYFLPVLIKLMPKEDTHIGRFRILNCIGEGGFGIVYKCYDEKLRREVAIKMPRVSLDEKPEGKLQAIREARAAARLDHPGIVPLLDVVDFPNQTILVSSFVQGNSLSNWLKNRSKFIPTKLAAQWALEISYAMVHAHARGVLHCDLKPGNILLEIPENSNSDELIFPKVTDFGLARLTGVANSTLTGPGMGLGTPMNMAPEQTQGRDALTVSCDIYGLGTILYQLLANAAPFKATTLGELLKEVLENAPTPLKTYRKDLHSDLEAICLKCMEKKPALRYATMNDLALDLERFLKGKPTAARPLGMITTSVRWIYNHAILVILLGVIISSLSTSTVIFIVLFQKMSAQAEDNLIQKNLADTVSERNLRDRMLSDRQFYSSEMRSIQNAFKDGEFASVKSKLNTLTPVDFGGKELRGFEWHYWNKLCSHSHQKAAAFEDFALKYSLNGNKHAAISFMKSDSISIVDISTSKEIKFISGAQLPTYSTNGTTLAFVTSDNVIQWVDAFTFKVLGSFKNEVKTNRLLFLDETRLVVLQLSNWKVLDISSGSILWEKPKEQNLYQYNLCNAGKDRLAIWNNNGRIQIWDVALKTKVDDFSCEGRLCLICESSNDGKKIAWTTYPSKFIVRDIETKTNLVSKELKDSFTFAMAWSPDDKQIALGTMEHTIDIINPENGEHIERRTGHSLRNINQIKWFIGGKLSSLACQMYPEKSELLFWDEDRVASSKVIHTLEKPALGFVLDAKSEIALVFEESTEISLISLPEGKLHKRVKLPDISIASAAHPFNPYFVVILDNREIWKVDHQGNSTRTPIRCPSPPSGAIIISPSGDSLAIGLNASEFDGVNTDMINLYNIETGKLIATYLGGLSLFNELANLPKTDSFIVSQGKGAIVALNWRDGTLIKEYLKDPSEITLGTINSELNLISVVKGLRTLKVMNFPAMTNARDFRNVEVNFLRGLKWTEDSTRLIGWGLDGTIRFWDGTTGQELLKLNAHEGMVVGVTELPGGRKILSLGKDNQLKLWDATPIN